MLAFDQARNLHGQRRGARDDVAVLDQLPGRARERARIDAVVGVEALVLECHQHGEIALIDLGGIERQPPAAFPGREGAQQAVVAVEHGCRHLVRVRKIGWTTRNNGERDPSRNNQAADERRTDPDRQPMPQPWRPLPRG